MVRVTLLLGLVMLLTPRGVGGVENDFKVVEGVLVRPVQLPEDSVAEISAGTGGVYYIDLRALSQEPARIDLGTHLTIVGYEGGRPDLITAYIVKLHIAPDSGAATERRSADLHVVEGRVQSVSRRALTLRTDDGRTMTLPLTELFRNPRYAFVVGERLRVFGVLAGDDTLMPNVLVQQSRPSPPRVGPDAEGGYGP